MTLLTAMMNVDGGSAACVPGDVDVARWVIQLARNLREVFTITERAFSWLKAPTSALTFKKLLLRRFSVIVKSSRRFFLRLYCNH